MSESSEEKDNNDPIVIDISLRNQVRKERIVAVVFVLLIAGLSYIIYLNR
jgi:hypothetical protein